MTERKPTPSYSAEFRERGVRLLNEHRAEYGSDNAAYKAISSKLGCSPDSLRGWCQRAGLSSEEKNRIKELEREVRELRQANEILKKASAYFAQAELDRPFKR
jgi:transposase